VIPGKLLSGSYKRCYAATVDAKLVAEKYMGVPPEKCVVTPLGVDTHVFKPSTDPTLRQERKTRLGFDSSDFVVLYTGRFAYDKNPLLLAKAIDLLQKKSYTRIKGLFVGSGDQKKDIESCAACTIVDFVPYFELYQFYQIADLGVWPTQESTSMLDAAATGIPIIVNHTVHATERHQGNGLTYDLGNIEDLAEKILTLYNDPKLREKLGQEGERKMREEFSWDKIAKEREADYVADKMAAEK
jgi:glycosyltransferase involved in cell wall biosynthesis